MICNLLIDVAIGTWTARENKSNSGIAYTKFLKTIHPNRYLLTDSFHKKKNIHWMIAICNKIL